MDKRYVNGSAIIILGVAVLLMIISFIYTIISSNQMHEHCINVGYEGLANFNTEKNEFRCYKYVKHESGLGSEIVYSELFKLEQIKGGEEK